ncbi:peptidoglycan DD-metalloendopeptidase family protein [Rhodococcus sp. SGAir0479]|uniref:peptidoglycan DD-metalloendopeptidase family protein n=1 Tax=Rhodococcus sp. SGAir0479 TaxID=2567884 RepID=UPI0020C7BE83|nr:peptidoglycan DD-metalloendopeptidase family protein [Rhodococcus sp. SGAir0479]
MAPKFWPLERGRIITSQFGRRGAEFHYGTDFGRVGGSGGLPVYAVQGGTVIMAGPADGFGRWVVLDHPTADGGGTTVYGHVIPEVELGQRVEAGQRIASINPDRSSNGGVDPHLHLEWHRFVWVPPGPDRLDPAALLTGAEDPYPFAGGGTLLPPVQYGIDVSNHQKNFDFAAARAEGFTWATHKVTEGTWRDPFWPRAREEMRKHFTGRFGGYAFCRVDTDPQREADTYLDHAGGTDFPLQIDYEDDENRGSLDDLLARISAYRERGVRLLPVYIPRWYWRDHMGAPNLSGLPVGVWNSDYVAGTGYASNLYPGNGYKGWEPFHPGAAPVQLLQFSERGRVAGQTVDVNAFRGTTLELDALFAGVPNLQEALMSVADDELGKLFPSRSIYRDSDEAKHRLAAFLSNIDAREHERFVEDQARKGIPEYVDLVRRVARDGIVGNTDGFGYPELVNESKRRAQAILDEIGAK